MFIKTAVSLLWTWAFGGWTLLSLNLVMLLKSQTRHKVNSKDGLAEISPDYAIELGFVQAEDVGKAQYLHNPVQFRGMLQLSTGETVLAKGMLVINGKLTQELRLPESCIKVRNASCIRGHSVCITAATRPMAALGWTQHRSERQSFCKLTASTMSSVWGLPFHLRMDLSKLELCRAA